MPSRTTARWRRPCAPLKARAGVHVGPVILRENSAADIAQGAKPLEVEGTAKPMAARVMSIARGGQTLLTADARTALGATRLRLQSHGHWRLQGILQPIEVFEAGDAEAPFTPPEDAPKVYRVVPNGDLWLPARQIPCALPAERDAFIGRVAPLDELARRLQGRCPAGFGARHGRNGQDAPGHALRLEPARGFPGRCVVLRSVAGPQPGRHRPRRR